MLKPPPPYCHTCTTNVCTGESRSQGVINRNQACLADCNGRHGYCPWCGSGACCRQGFVANGCGGTNGGSTRHECVGADKIDTTVHCSDVIFTTIVLCHRSRQDHCGGRRWKHYRRHILHAAPSSRRVVSSHLRRGLCRQRSRRIRNMPHGGISAWRGRVEERQHPRR